MMNLAFEAIKNKPINRVCLPDEYEIVSLWDMIPFYASLWLKLCWEVGNSTGTSETYRWMNKALDDFLAQQGLKIKPGEIKIPPLPNPMWMGAVFCVVRDMLTDTGLKVTAECVQEIIDFVQQKKYEKEDIQPLFNEFLRVLQYELETMKIMMIPANKASYYDGSANIFSEKVHDNFPSADKDMEEAGKCFALDQNTACVFHAMRVLEPGLKALGKALDGNVEINWNTALNEIEAEIRRRNKGNQGPNWKDDEPFYSEAATHFRFLKNAWRNYVMHGKEHYDEKQAKKILNNVRDFMSEIAERLSEEDVS